MKITSKISELSFILSNYRILLNYVLSKLNKIIVFPIFERSEKILKLSTFHSHSTPLSKNSKLKSSVSSFARVEIGRIAPFAPWPKSSFRITGIL